MNEYSQEKFWTDLISGKFAMMVKESSKGQTVSNSAEVYNILKPIFAKYDDVEVLYGIFLDAKNHVLEIRELSRGTLTSSMVYPREIVKQVIAYKAAAVILVHNHPSGDTSPSQEDIEITKRVGLIMHILGVTLHDHTIIGNGYYSMSDSGWIRKMQGQFHKTLNDI